MAEAVRHDKTARQLRLLSDALDSGRLGPVRRLVNTLSPAEIGNLLESLPPGKRNIVWGLVDPEDDGEVLVHVGDDVRESLLADMDPDEIVAAVEDLDIDDLADLIEDLPDTVIDEVLKSMDRENRERLEQALSYPEDSAGRLMNPDVITVRADVTVDVVLRYLRLRGEMPDHTDHLFVVSRRHQYLGRVATNALLTHDAVDADQRTDRRRAAGDRGGHAGQRSGHASSPTTTGSPRRWWTTTTSCSAASPSMTWSTSSATRPSTRRSSAAGLDEDEDLFSPVPRAARRRALWLGINLRHGLPRLVGGRPFEATLEQVVALAVLMPIVASMGGNRRHPGADADGARPGAGPGRRRQPARAAVEGSPGRRCSTASSGHVVVGVVVRLWFQDRAARHW